MDSRKHITGRYLLSEIYFGEYHGNKENGIDEIIIY
jgi:hypothetical protein